MVFTRRTRTGRYSTPVRTFPVYRPMPPTDGIEEIEKEREKLKALIEYEEALEVFREEVEAYYAGKSSLEAVLEEMMASAICHKLSVWESVR